MSTISIKIQWNKDFQDKTQPKRLLVLTKTGQTHHTSTLLLFQRLLSLLQSKLNTKFLFPASFHSGKRIIVSILLLLFKTILILCFGKVIRNLRIAKGSIPVQYREEKRKLLLFVRSREMPQRKIHFIQAPRKMWAKKAYSSLKVKVEAAFSLQTARWSQ